jgi:hypothetical protein
MILMGIGRLELLDIRPLVKGSCIRTRIDF